MLTSTVSHVHGAVLGGLLLFALTAPVGAQEEPAAGAPGFEVTFTSGDAVDVEVRPNLWLHVPAGESPTPFLPGGEFTAVYRGRINVDLRSTFMFQSHLSGSLKLEVNGDVEMETTGDGGLSELSGRIRLSKGPNDIVATFTSPESGDAFFRMLWQPRNSFSQPIPQTAITHEPGEAFAEARARREGRHLVLEHRCLSCHTAEGFDLPEAHMDAPSFAGIGTRRNAAWLAKWVMDPHAMRDTARMPKLVASEVQANDIAAHLAGLTADTETAPTGADDALIARGEHLFTSFHCIACHQSPAAESTDDTRLSLKGVNQKFSPGALSGFLKNPGEHFEWIRMPDFRLSDDEAAALAAFVNLHADEPLPVFAGGDAANGGRLIESLGCVNCHAGTDAAKREAPAWSALGNWDAGCLSATDASVSGVPYFGFTAEQREFIRAFATSGPDSLQRHVPVDFAQRHVEELNCISCHDRQIDLVPPLKILGGKIKPEWGAEFIAGKVDKKPRPWVEARMPGFAAHAEGVAQGLASLHGFPAITPEPEPINEELATIGRDLIGAEGGFSCISCHGVGDLAATQVFESAGINLATSAERLQREYYHWWLMDPLQVDPTSKMPVYFDPQGGSPLFNVLDGSADKQLEAMWQYMRQGEDMVPPPSPGGVAPQVHGADFE